MIQVLGKSLIFLVLGLFMTPAMAVVAKADMSSLREVLIRYQKSPQVDIELEKKVTSEILGREKIHRGKASLAPQRFRLETYAPDKTLIVYDGTTLWNVQYPPEESDSAIQIAKAKLDQKTQNQVLLGDLLVGQGLLNKFDITETKRDGSTLIVKAKPKQQIPVGDLTFNLNLKDKVIESLGYSDDLGNKIVMNFQKTNFQKKKNSKLFQYKPEKGAQVTDL